jgi:hypothetical protein
MSVAAAAKEIEGGFESLRTVLGDPKTIAPFFRIPGLLRQDSVERYLAAHGYATWSLDFLADDWTHISANEVARRALQRIEARGRGILLLHDIQPATALALPTILAELKARGYKIVHVVPATADRPATVADNDEWVQRHPTRPSWPRVLSPDTTPPRPTLEAPSPANFGVAERSGQLVAMTNPLGQRAPWPSAVAFTVPAETEMMPSPSAEDFVYHVIRARSSFAASPRKPTRPSLLAAKGGTKPGPSRVLGLPKGPASARARPSGHQLTIGKPTASVIERLESPRPDTHPSSKFASSKIPTELEVARL